ncbi:MBOAT family protein [Geitlerinema sp. PCC 7407]|uniref:MBOAT family O-acyltransferase n=1 Tax=Geitlerinema sp. PCC 7407 TaxID=1173025 RepID=UPI00029FC58A|nr:MBOAT family protein [Geitlerinema sp. PCC 7407]AFY65406.1 membrane bound O-acyl transferase MBOAT family protein [Geitlerinema sp. PCC 7407]
MTLLSLLYALFLGGVITLFWLAQHQSQRLWVLLVASLIFYSASQPQNFSGLLVTLGLLMGFTGLNFGLGLVLSRPLDWRISNENWQFAQQDWNRSRLALLWAGIALNLLLLFSYKYIPFVLRSLGTLLNLPAAAVQADWISESLVVPLGISFFCFENIAYLVDIYRGAPATQQFLKFASYKFFFPKLISGPITRYHPFAKQLQTLKIPTPNQVVEGLWLIACGAIKKGLLADNLGTVVDLIFGNLQRAGSSDLWLGAIAYGFQLYLDFSGYVDIVLGSALLLGFSLPPNFNFPYLSTSIADFWRRWHMTLGDWLRNYLYFPLGGSRQGLGRTCVNLMIVMVLAGIWHGAAWGFIVWGALHGVALAVHRLTDAHAKGSPWAQAFWASLPGTLVAWSLTQAMVFITWIFFRLPDLRDSSLVIRRLWGQTADAQFTQKIYVEALSMSPAQIWVILGTIAAGMGFAYTLQRGLKLQLSPPIKAMLIPLCIFIVWLLAPQGGLPYIYFDF